MTPIQSQPGGKLERILLRTVQTVWTVIYDLERPRTDRIEAILKKMSST
jgi:hypothetical protein